MQIARYSLSYTVVAFIIAEVFLRFILLLSILPEMHPIRMLFYSGNASRIDKNSSQFRASENKNLGWEPIPSTDKVYYINQLGLRGKETAPDNKETFRIGILGDSEVFGTCLSEEETIPSVIEKKLSENCDRPIEILNLGVPGYGLKQYYEIIQNRITHLHPEIVMLVINFNDAELSTATTFREGDPFYRSLYTYKLYIGLRVFLMPFIIESLTNDDYYKQIHTPAYYKILREHLALMQEKLSLQKSTLYAALLPLTVYAPQDYAKKYPYHSIHKSVDTIIAEETGAQPIDLLNPLQNVAKSTSLDKLACVAKIDNHKSSIAVAALAEHIALALIAQSDVLAESCSIEEDEN